MSTTSFVLRFLALATCNIALSILALERTWAWFVVPLGVPAMTYAHAIGLRFTIGFFTTAGVLTPPGPKQGADVAAHRAASLQQQAGGIVATAVILSIAWGIR